MWLKSNNRRCLEDLSVLHRVLQDGGRVDLWLASRRRRVDSVCLCIHSLFWQRLEGGAGSGALAWRQYQSALYPVQVDGPMGPAEAEALFVSFR